MVTVESPRRPNVDEKAYSAGGARPTLGKKCICRRSAANGRKNADLAAERGESWGKSFRGGGIRPSWRKRRAWRRGRANIEKKVSAAAEQDRRREKSIGRRSKANVKEKVYSAGEAGPTLGEKRMCRRGEASGGENAYLLSEYGQH